MRIDKRLDGVRVCRTCIAHSRLEECVRCAARREPVTRDEQDRPVCANCFITDPANLQTCIHCGRRRRVGYRTPEGPLGPSCGAGAADLLDLRRDHPVRHLADHRPTVVSSLPAPLGRLLGLRAAQAHCLGHLGPATLLPTGRS
ncbi:MAG: hypothetical protein ACRDST_21955 [Pseudonocardiaceae bacterium]